MTVAMQADRPDRAGALERGFDRAQALIDRCPPGRQQIGRNVGMGEQPVARLGTEGSNVKVRPTGKRRARTDRMDAANEASDPLERVRVLEFGSTAAAARIDRKTIAFEIVQAAAFGNQWGHHRDFAVGKLGGKGMLFENLLIAPALRAIELRDHDAAIFHPGLIDTIFVTVEGEQTSIASPSDRFKGVKDPVRLQR